MKKRLTFLLLLCTTLAGLAQNTTTKTVVIAPAPGKTGVSYTVQLVRNWTDYPATTTGLTSWTAAISKGTFSLTVVGSGCLIPAGTIPPLTAPICTSATSGTTTGSTSTTVTIPAFSQTVAYVSASKSSFASSDGGHHTDQFITSDDYADYTITGAPATDGTYSLSINYQTNFDSPTTGLGSVVVNGGSPLDFTTQGASGGTRTASISSLSLHIGTNTVRIQGKSNTFFQNYITLTRASSLSVVTTGGSSGTLTGGSSGTTTTASSNTSAATLAGGFAEASTVAELFAFAPFTPILDDAHNQFTTAFGADGSGGMTAQYISNDTIKAGFARDLGGALFWLSEGTGGNLINNNFRGTSLVDNGDHMAEDGREAGVSIYMTPYGGGDPFTAYSSTLGRIEADNGIGYNANPGGSNLQDHSKVLHYEKQTVNIDGGIRQVVYFKVQPVQWDFHNVLSEVYVHSFYYLKGHNVKAMYIVENFRTDTQMSFQGRLNELPFIYIRAPYYQYYVYTGNSPDTSGALTQINGSQPCEGAGTAGCPNQNDTGGWISTENFILANNPTTGHAIAIVTPYNTSFTGKQFQGWYGDDSTNASAYLNGGPTLNMDTPGTKMAFQCQFYAGTLSDFRSNLNANPISKTPFSFSFSAGKTNAWWGGVSKFDSDNRYYFKMGRYNDGNPNQSFTSPWGAWQASTMDTLYIKGKFSGISTIDINWTRPGETPIQSAQNNNKTWSVNGDGAERTYAIPMVGTSTWSGMIAQVKIQNPYPFPALTGNETFTPTYIGKINPH